MIEYYIFVLCLVVGFWLAYQYGKDTTQFKWSEYFATLIVPYIGLGILVWYEGRWILGYYVATCFAGNIAEHVGGWAVHKILGHRLWTYHRLTMGGYTSALSWPYWGMIGIVFLGIYKLFG